MLSRFESSSCRQVTCSTLSSTVRTDRIQEELKWLRLVLPILALVHLAVMGYLISSPVGIVWTLAAVTLAVAFLVAVYVVVTVQRLLRALDEERHDVP
jgi:hypothetical protein